MFRNLCYRNWQKLDRINSVAFTNRGNYVQIFRHFKRNSRPRFSGTNSSGPPIGGTKQSLAPTPFSGVRVETGPVSSSAIARATIFTVAFTAGSFIGVSVWEYESLRARFRDRSQSFSWFRNKLNQKKYPSDWRKEVDSWWSRLSPGERVFVPLCALNILVFGLWRLPRLQPFMVKYFCSNPAARAICWPMCLSTFSHYSLFHIFANMYVLHSFSNVAVATLGKEQFIGLYLSAGVISSLASYIFKAATSQAGLSLGASGAIMAILGYVCFEYPETRLSILFLPMYTFSAGTAIKVIMCFDLAGVIMRWKFFDHAAHLGGALYGLFWCYIGKTIIWPQREHFLRQYHQLRGSAKK